MAITLSTGSVFAIASTYGTSVTMSAITNASEAVATLAAGHSVVVGDYLEVTSGWGRLDKKIVRVKTVATNNITFEGVNTSNNTTYPTGSGTGSIRRITAWTNLSQVQSSSVSGGDLQYADVTAIDDVVAKQIPTIRSAVSLSLTVFDDPSLAWYSVVANADDTRTPHALRITSANGANTVANAYWSLQRTPNIQQNAAMTTSIGLSYAAEPTRYAT